MTQKRQREGWSKRQTNVLIDRFLAQLPWRLCTRDADWYTVCGTVKYPFRQVTSEGAGEESRVRLQAT